MIGSFGLPGGVEWVVILSLCVLVVILPAGALFVLIWHLKKRDRETRCRKCGYILRGITEPRCPECGERI